MESELEPSWSTSSSSVQSVERIFESWKGISSCSGLLFKFELSRESVNKIISDKGLRADRKWTIKSGQDNQILQ